MKKILTSLAVVASLATIANADFARVEAGAGIWAQAPSGTTSYTNHGATVTETYREDEQENTYFWALVKHPIPIIPNLRVEYVNITGDADNSVSALGYSTSTGSTSVLEMTQIDLVPYYNILDNTFWMTVDLGLDLKVMDISYKADGVDVVPSDVSSVVLPLAYIRARVEIPFSGIGVESDVKYLSYDTSTFYDARAKVDYTFNFVPIVQPTVEVGYRVQKIELSDSDFTVDNEFSGVYFGVGARF